MLGNAFVLVEGGESLSVPFRQAHEKLPLRIAGRFAHQSWIVQVRLVVEKVAFAVVVERISASVGIEGVEQLCITLVLIGALVRGMREGPDKGGEAAHCLRGPCQGTNSWSDSWSMCMMKPDLWSTFVLQGHGGWHRAMCPTDNPDSYQQLSRLVDFAPGKYSTEIRKKVVESPEEAGSLDPLEV